MNKLYKKIKEDIKRDQSIYYGLIITIVISIVFGALFITILKESDKELVLGHLTDFLNSISSNGIDHTKIFKNSVFSNNIYLIIMWLLGISAIGMPIIILMLFFKGFVLGFSVTSIIYQYKLSGLLGSLVYIFPHLIINIIVYFVVSYYALKLSLTIIQCIFKRKPIDIKIFINKYLVILGMSIILLLISSLIEAYITPFFVRMFLILVQ